MRAQPAHLDDADHRDLGQSGPIWRSEGRRPRERVEETVGEANFGEFLRNWPAVTFAVTFAVTLGAHVGVMTSVLMAAMDREWAAWGCSLESRAALCAVAEHEPLVAGLLAHDLGDVVRLVRRGTGGLPSADAGRVVAALLRGARAHPLVARALLQCLMVGVPREITRLGQMVAAWGSFDDALDEGLVMLGIVVMEWAGEDRPYAALDVLSAVRCRLRRQILGELAHRDHEISTTLATRHCLGEHGIEELRGVLGDARSLGLLPEDAALMTLIAVHGYTMGEVAEMTGKSHYELARQKKRAARCLVA